MSPPYGESVDVPVFYPSDDQMARRCDGCARSHHNNNARCGANAFSGRESVILEGNQFVDPPCNPGEVVTFHSMTHDPGAVYKGYLEGIDTHRGRKAGIATITFTA